MNQRQVDPAVWLLDAGVGEMLNPNFEGVIAGYTKSDADVRAEFEGRRQLDGRKCGGIARGERRFQHVIQPLAARRWRCEEVPRMNCSHFP
jgi:hypothetical protein